MGMARRPKDPDELNDQQQRFCEEYIKDLSGKYAATRAGYSEHTAKQIASRALADPRIQERIEELKAARSKRTAITADKILRELYWIATLDPADVFDDQGQMKPLSAIPRRARRAISGLEVHEIFDGQGDQKHVIGIARKPKFCDKNRANELLGKHLKLFIEKIEHSGPNDGPIEFSDNEAAAKLTAILNAARDRKAAK